MNLKNKQELKKMKSILTLGGCLGLTGYVLLVEKRSMRSFLIEKGLWAVGAKRMARRMTETSFRTLINNYRRLPSPSPHVIPGLKIQHAYINHMKVYKMAESSGANHQVILFIYGAGYIGYPFPIHYTFVSEILRKTHGQVYFPLYPLAPEHTYEEAIEELSILYDDLLKHHNSRDILIFGDSSGGGLALALTLKLKKEGKPLPYHMVLSSPWVDVTMENKVCNSFEDKDPVLSTPYLRLAGRAWAGSERSWLSEYVSPIYGDYEGMPPMTVFAGTNEVFLPDIMKFILKLKSAKVPYELILGQKMLHDYPLYPTPEAKEARAHIAEIILKHQRNPEADFIGEEEMEKIVIF